MMAAATPEEAPCAIGGTLGAKTGDKAIGGALLLAPPLGEGLALGGPWKGIR